MENELQKQEWSKLSIISLVIVLVSILIWVLLFVDVLKMNNFILYCLWILPVISFVTSIVSLVLIKKYNLKGKFFSWISLILAVVVFFVAGFFNFFPLEIFFD